jgi:hypothetical protein
MRAASNPIAGRFSCCVNFRLKIRDLPSIRACRFWFAAVIDRTDRHVFASGADQPYNQGSARVHGTARILSRDSPDYFA